MDSDVETAGKLLTATVFCRDLAMRLDACLEGGGRCESEGKAFMECATREYAKVVNTLAQIAGKYCPAEVDAFQKCKVRGGKCEAQDLAAMRCASKVVIETAAAEKAAS